jgi:hypothetical protein
MTTLRRATVIAAIVVSLGVASYEAHRASTLESELQVLLGQNASLAAQTQQQESKREDTGHRAERAEPLGNASTAANSELLRLRREVGLLRRQLAAAEAKPQPATNRILFTHPVLPRAVWSDHGTDKPVNTILTMFWALRQGDQSKLEQRVWRMRDSQTLDDLTFRRDDWDRISAIQVAKVVVTQSLTAGKVTQENATVEVIVEKAPLVDGADKDVDIERWFLMKTNDQWLIRTTL